MVGCHKRRNNRVMLLHQILHKVNDIIRGFNRNEFSKQSGIKDQKDILIYYYSEPKQLQKLLNYAESFKGYQMIVVLSNSMYENNGAKHALFNTLQANNNIGLVLIDKKNEIPAFKRIKLFEIRRPAG